MTLRDGYEIGRGLQYWTWTEDQQLIWLADGEMLRGVILDLARDALIGIPFVRTPDPSNADYHDQVFASQTRSWRDMPYRIAELGERSVVSAYLPEDSVAQEWQGLLECCSQVVKRLGVGDACFLVSSDLPGTMVDLVRTLGRCQEAPVHVGGPHVQVCAGALADGTLPIWKTRLGLSELGYAGRDGARCKVARVRAEMTDLGTLVAQILTTTNGALCFGLAPEQVHVIARDAESEDYASDIGRVLEDQGYRVRQSRLERHMSGAIKEISGRRVPVILVVGQRETRMRVVNVRLRGQGDVGAMSEAELLVLLGSL